MFAGVLMCYNVWIVLMLILHGNSYTVDQIRNVLLNGIYITSMVYVLLQF